MTKAELNRLTVSITVAGLVVAALTLWRAGLRETFGALAAVGFFGAILFTVSYVPVLLALGAAWSSAQSPPRHRYLAFVVARTLREAANDLLPFSQVGGLVIGLRALSRSGIGRTSAYASTIIDLTTELASQLLLMLLGTAAALYGRADSGDRPSEWIAVGTGVGLLAALSATSLFLREPLLRLAAVLASRMLPAANEGIADVRGELERFGRRPFAMVPPFLWNLVAWMLSVLCVWFAFRLLGRTVSPTKVLALEAFVSVVRSSSFLVPGALGAQELGYVALAHMLGLDPQAALSVSLMKRARDLAIGLPVLLIWHAEMLRFKGTRASPAPGTQPGG